MQDRYVGDTPDFGKYAILRHFHEYTNLRLGVNWYRTLPSEVDKSDNADGETRHHVKLPHIFQTAAPELYRDLVPLHEKNYRTLESVERRNILPSSTLFFSDYLSYGNPRSPDSIKIRKNWFDRSLKALENCDLIFCDPDTGPETKSMFGRSHYKQGPKYAYFDEIAAYRDAGKSVIVIKFIRQYKGGIDKAVKDTLDLLTQYNAIGNKGYALEFPSGRNSTYFILPTHEHEEIIGRAVHMIRKSPIASLYKQRA